MSDPIMYAEDYFVVLESGEAEQIVTESELLEKLQAILATRQADLPQDVQKFTTIPEQAQYLLHNYCEFDPSPGEFFQWYAVRLEKD
ncbi:MAG: chlororespiratory reduction protein 7 [Microcoleaceae cyanobacterium]